MNQLGRFARLVARVSTIRATPIRTRTARSTLSHSNVTQRVVSVDPWRHRGFASHAETGPETPSDTDADSDAETRRRKANSDDKDVSRALTHRLLQDSMKHVSEHGWSTEALRSGAIELNLSPAMVGQVPNGVGSMVRHFCDNCDSRLSVKLVLELDELMNGDFSQQMSPSQKLATVIKWRLDMLKPVIDTWPQALAIQAAPKNAAATATRVALLADELVSAMGPDGVGLTRVTRAITAPDQLPIPPEDVSGDDTQKDDSSNYSSKKEEEVKPTSSPFAALSSLGWYADRAAVGALYQACEVFMVADTSPGFQDTYDFVDTRCGLEAFPNPPHRPFDAMYGTRSRKSYHYNQCTPESASLFAHCTKSPITRLADVNPFSVTIAGAPTWRGSRRARRRLVHLRRRRRRVSKGQKVSRLVSTRSPNSRKGRNKSWRACLPKSLRWRCRVGEGRDEYGRAEMIRFFFT